jgi:hypothetical protein
MRRVAAGLLALFLVALVVAPALAGCGGNADQFTGLYWEPSSGRRVEIRKEGDTYWLYYGAAKQAYQAKLEGDELVIAEPMGGQTVVRHGETEGTLELDTAGKTTLLKRLQQHQ